MVGSAATMLDCKTTQVVGPVVGSAATMLNCKTTQVVGTVVGFADTISCLTTSIGQLK